jgi:hypothetical protein
MKPFNEIVGFYLKAVGDRLEVVSDRRGPILRRPGRDALARAVGRSAPRPHRFSELPSDRHRVSANASETEPAKLLAVFMVDTNETELTTPLGN